MRKFSSVAFAVSCVGALLTTTIVPAQATIVNITYSGVIQHIINPDGTNGGTYSLSGGGPYSLPDPPPIGSTFSGTMSFDPAAATLAAPSSVEQEFDFAYGSVFPTLTLNGSQNVALKPKLSINVVNNLDTSTVSNSLYEGALHDLGFSTIPNPVDAVFLYGDMAGFTSNPDGSNGNGFEFNVFSIDPTASALSSTALPDPLLLLSDAFFLYRETINGVQQPAGFGTISFVSATSTPEPATLAVFALGLAGLGVMRRRRRAT